MCVPTGTLVITNRPSAFVRPVRPVPSTVSVTFAPGGENAEIVGQIKELLDSRVRPAVAQDGGDITFHGFDGGVVYLHMQGACAGCPSSTLTLKMGIENLLKQSVTLPHRSDDVSAAHLNVIQGYPRGIATVDHARFLDHHPFRAGIHQKQADPLLFGSLTGAAGADDQLVGNMPIQHHHLAAIENVTISIGTGGGLNIGWPMVSLLVDSQCHQHFAFDDCRQKFLLLSFVAAQIERGCGQQHGRDKG